MSELTYEAAPVAVREDLTLAHRRAWQRLSRPGTWWTGEQRVAIAAEARNAMNCSVCRRRKEALSPFAVQGEHDSLGALPEAVIDVIHRIRTDPGRLSKRWYEGILASGVGEAPYVEIVGVVITVVAVDTFARGLGVPAPALPDPVAGEPSRIRPETARLWRAWVPMIDPEDAKGSEADLYGAGIFVPNVRRALSLVPAEARGFADVGTAHYFSLDEMMDITRRRGIDRSQIELLAARVSAINGCFY